MSSRTLGGATAALLALVAAGAVAVATDRTDEPDTPGALATATGPSTAHARLTDPPSGDAGVLLAALPVRTDPDPTGYRRAAFGEGWTDPDGNGCTTREDVLRADAVPETVLLGDDGCLDDATIVDPYTGANLTPRTAEIDHVVPLADAWRSGAAAWTPARRAQFAEDTRNLLAVYDRANSAKGDDTADAWLPPDPGYRCAYVARQVAVKSSYHLSVTATEKAASRAVLATCPGQTVPGPGR